MHSTTKPQPRYWRGMLRLTWGRMTDNPKLIAAGRLEQALARIAAAHARINREAERQMRQWRARHADFFARRRPSLRLVR